MGDILKVEEVKSRLRGNEAREMVQV